MREYLEICMKKFSARVAFKMDILPKLSKRPTEPITKKPQKKVLEHPTDQRKAIKLRILAPMHVVSVHKPSDCQENPPPPLKGKIYFWCP